MTQSLNNNNNKTILQGSNHIITGLEAGAEDMGKSYGQGKGVNFVYSWGKKEWEEYHKRQKIDEAVTILHVMSRPMFKYYITEWAL